MRVVAFIPARYDSSRFRGKPLADICQRPMIWWVYHQVKKTKKIHEVYVAADSEEVFQTCKKYQIPCLMTSREHTTSTERIYEAAKRIPADVYICVNGDEPLIDPDTVEKIIPEKEEDFFAANLMTQMRDPAEVVDSTNIKVVTDEWGNALFLSRSPIPYPKATLSFSYYKHLGVLAYSIEALHFFAQTQKGRAELAEDINELRFLEHGKKLKMILVQADTLSVDTPKDLEYVRKVIEEKLQRGELSI